MSTQPPAVPSKISNASKVSGVSSKTEKSQPGVPTETELDWEVRPEFIYGGPFIKPPTKPPFMDSSNPINMPLQGTFKKSFAYYSLKERMPVILTKVIDYCSRESAKIASSCSASQDSVTTFIKYVTKLKNDLVTNKNYDLLTVGTPDALKWNQWIEAQDQKTYFTNTWVFSECYVYRRLREGVELAGLKNFDPFDEQKKKSFYDNVEPMCVVADKLVTMLPESEKDKRKADFITLLKLCLWSNKCDLSLSAGAAVSLSGEGGGGGEHAPLQDPFQMILDLKDKLLVDDTGKIADAVVNKADTIAKNIAAPPSAEAEGEAPETAVEASEDVEPEKIPCPAKMTVPQSVMFDIICDNAGYELFTDFCLAHFLISQGIVQKVRFHVKQIPWFVSDVTLKDFVDVIDWCANADYSRTIVPEPKPESEEETPEVEPTTITSTNLRSIGEKWGEYMLDGTFELLAEDYWTWPHVYKDMKRIDYNLYRKLQLGCALLFKGDLNYRKLLGERKCNPYLGFEASLQGFIPAPIIAVRTVKSELVSGLPKGKFDQINKIDPKWMEKGDYGVIQYCAKGEALKVSDRPCVDYGTTCFSGVCPKHTDM